MVTIMRGNLGYLLTNFSSILARRVSSFPKSHRVLFHCSSLFNGQGQELKMPSLSPTMTEGKIVKWLKKEGDIIAPGDVLCDIETDKAVVSMEVEEEGILAKILVAENSSNIKVGSLIGLMVSQGEDWKNVDLPKNLEVSTSESSFMSGTSSSFSESFVSELSATPVKMPSLSPTMTAGTIVKWLKKEGDLIAAGDVLCDIQTDKAIMSLEAEDDGILAKIILADDSKDVAVGTIIGLVVPEGEDWKRVTIASHELSAEKKDNVLSQFLPNKADGINEIKGKTFGPAVRALLSLYQLNPDLIEATGKNNRLLKEDVMKYIETNNLKSKPLQAVSTSKLDKSMGIKLETVNRLKSAPTNTSKYKDIELSDVRIAAAKRLLESKQNIPHSYFTIKCDVDNLLKTKEYLLIKGIQVTLNDFLTKATTLALQLYPKANAQFINNKVILSEKVDINLAISTDLGLFTPVLKVTNQKSLMTISQEIRELSAKANSGQIKPEDLQSGTFTISNLGMYGITHFKGIINPPQCGILAVGGISEILNSDLVIQNQINLSLSYDSRVLEEDEAAKFMDALKYFIENPKLIVLDINHYFSEEL